MAETKVSHQQRLIEKLNSLDIDQMQLSKRMSIVSYVGGAITTVCYLYFQSYISVAATAFIVALTNLYLGNACLQLEI